MAFISREWEASSHMIVKEQIFLLMNVNGFYPLLY
jgi:hypothetical protein